MASFCNWALRMYWAALLLLPAATAEGCPALLTSSSSSRSSSSSSSFQHQTKLCKEGGHNIKETIRPDVYLTPAPLIRQLVIVHTFASHEPGLGHLTRTWRAGGRGHSTDRHQGGDSRAGRRPCLVRRLLARCCGRGASSGRNPSGRGSPERRFREPLRVSQVVHEVGIGMLPVRLLGPLPNRLKRSSE